MTRHGAIIGGMPRPYVPLHLHTQYSILDGASRIKDLPKIAAELGMPAMAVTDSGVMYATLDWVNTATYAGIKPIVGCELTLIDGDMGDRSSKVPYQPLVLLCKDNTGYQNLVKLVSRAHLEGFYYKPRINWDLLQDHCEGLIALSGPQTGPIAYPILRGNPQDATTRAKWLKDHFGDDFYLQLYDHGLESEQRVVAESLDISKALDITCVVTHDSRFTRPDDAAMHDIIMCLQTGKLLNDPNRFNPYGADWYIQGADQLLTKFAGIERRIIEAGIDETLAVADKCNLVLKQGESILPDYPIPPESTAETPTDYLREVVDRHANQRYNHVITPAITERLDFELNIINQMGFPAYFLIVWDFMNYARTNDIPVGPGRGSAAGSLVAYVLGITNIDPLEHNLLFERFLNPERVSMPDIDIDFCIDRREQVIDYVGQRYGKARVCQIATFGTLAARAALKAVGRVLDMPFAESDKLAKMIPATPGTKLKDALADGMELKAACDADPKVQQWIDLALSIEGSPNSIGMHAAGVVIAKDPLENTVPLARSKDGQTLSQYPMGDLEKLGLLKMDFLGLRNLTIIDHTLKLIEAGKPSMALPKTLPSPFKEKVPRERRMRSLSSGNLNLTRLVPTALRHPLLKRRGEQPAPPLDMDHLPLDDPKVFAMLSAGLTDGVFQLESGGMKALVKDLKPSMFEDINALVALFRPGPLNSGMVKSFVDRKHGREKVDFPHPDLEPILKDTYGTIVYQEQIMQIAQALAGYSLGQADLLRRAMGKKKADVMEKEREGFVNGSVARGVDADLANSLFSTMSEFAAYCFNRSHSAAYAMVAYQTAYLKAHYPVEYLSALLSSVSSDLDKIQLYIQTARRMGIKTLPPDVTVSGLHFTPDRGRKLSQPSPLPSPFKEKVPRERRMRSLNPVSATSPAVYARHPLLKRRGELLKKRSYKKAEDAPPGNIRFGLASIKNVGQGVVENLIAARAEKPFASLEDFCKRVDPKSLNRKTLESLISCGALSSFGYSRKQLLANVEELARFASRSHEQAASGQASLFDLLGGGDNANEPSFGGLLLSGPTDEFSDDEIQKMEKDLLGFYVSSHPLDAIAETLPLIVTHTIMGLKDAPEDTEVLVGGLISGLQKKVTKTNRPLWIANLEDMTGSVEFVLFSDAVERLGDTVAEGARVLIAGKVQFRGDNNDTPSLIVNGASLFNSVELLTLTFTSVPRFEDLAALGRLLAENRTKPTAPAKQGGNSPFRRRGGDGESVLLAGGVVPSPVIVGFPDGTRIQTAPKFWVEPTKRAGILDALERQFSGVIGVG
jgi:DNA polymerase III subunit alpha